MKRQPFALFIIASAIIFFAATSAFVAHAANPPLPQDIAVAPPLNDGTMPALAAIAGQGMMNDHAYKFLEDLSDNIGARVTGSPQCNAAIQWGLETMRAIGLQNVRSEPWQLFRGWTRISASAEMISPAPHKLMIDAMGSAPSASCFSPAKKRACSAPSPTSTRTKAKCKITSPPSSSITAKAR